MAVRRKKIDNLDGLAALYSGVLENLSIVHSADDAIENKVSAFLAASLVILTLALGRVQDWYLLTLLGAAILVISVILALMVLKSRSYHNAAVKVSDNTDYLDFENRALILQLISDCEDSISESEIILNRKAKIYPWILTLFVLGSAIILLSLYVSPTSKHKGVHDGSNRITSTSQNKTS
jgi:hypothetical protein